MPEQPPDRLHTVKSLTRAQHDAMCMREALLARQLPTSSLPGHVVFTFDHPGPPLAFARLSSYGDTYGGFGLVKTSRRTWQVLRRSGVPVPQSEIFSPDAHDSAAAYAQRIGFPAVICSRTGTYRRSADDAASFSTAFADVAERVGDPVLVHGTTPGELLRFLVQGQQVLAVTDQGRRATMDPENLDPALAELAVAAVEAIPGLDIASVIISTPTSKGPGAGRQALVERVMRAPHLRDFAGGSGRQALRLADQLVQSAADDLGLSLPDANAQVAAALTFTGVPEPESFTAELGAMVKALGGVTVILEPQSVPDGAELSIHGRPSDVALLITRSIAGFASGDSAHLVQCRPPVGG